MRKKLLFLSLIIIGKTELWSQAVESRLDYQKTLQSVATIDLPCPQDVSGEAVKGYMAKKGYKGSSFKDFTVYRAVKLDSSDADLSDLYFKIDHKSRKEKDLTVITLLPAKKNENILSRSLTDSSKMDGANRIEGAKRFLNELAPYVEAYHVNTQAKEQDEVLKKANKKMNGLMSDQADLEKRMRNLQTDLDLNKKEQAKEAQELQANIFKDDDAKKKAIKKMNRSMDDQGSLEKKIRKTQADLDQNKTDQSNQQQELTNQKQILDAIKAKQKS
ncbi:hypothetical protein ACX0G9_30935 [Flavitalea flava]